MVVSHHHFSIRAHAVEPCGPPEAGGRWDLSTTIEGVVGMHIAVLHTGKVLLFTYSEGGLTPSPTAEEENDANFTIQALNPNQSKCALWDPCTSSYSDIILNRALYCSGHFNRYGSAICCWRSVWH